MKDEQKKNVLGKLKLNKLSENELEKREMKVLKGGCSCMDGCSPNSHVGSSSVHAYAP
ncbi:TIGR04149 family rSAM-modified RiPP [Parabacteroides distasonis]|uniref:TIGR04149 family rSAM-modified RiPP n=1 Tax=Parabacteroides distasonis TaxID=823 RepID=UPI003F743CA2